MTGRELLHRACTLIFEDDEASWEKYAVEIINTLLAETLEANNGIRAFKGLDIMQEAPQIVRLDDLIPYEEELVNPALVYGLTARIIYDEDDLPKLSYFESKYVNAVNAVSKAKITYSKGMNL